MTVVDTAPFQNRTFVANGLRYQRSYRVFPDELELNMSAYREILGLMSKWSGVPFTIKYQGDFFSGAHIPNALRYILEHRGTLAAQLSPGHKALALRAACPECGIAEKHGLLNRYAAHDVFFNCPSHGEHRVSLALPSEVRRLEANAPTRNLIRSMTHLLDQDSHHIRVTGADYAGIYQEGLLYRPLKQWSALTNLGRGRTPHIFYAPLIVDWSGAKLSKSLYIRKDGYGAMKLLGTDGLLSYDRLKSCHGPQGLRRIWDEVETWFEKPEMLFRSYSVEYFQGILKGSQWT
jgi:hypothetical protein